MRLLIFIFILLLMAVGLSYLIHQDPGYIVIGYHHTTLATSLWVGVTLIAVAFFIFYFLIRLISNIFSIPAYFSRRRIILNLQRYEKYMTEGLTAMTIGEYKDAEKWFIRLARKKKQTITYLLAARAAASLQAYDRRDDYYKLAFQTAKDNTFAVSLAQGLSYLNSQQYDEALVTLKPLYRKHPKNILLLNALKVLYLHNKDIESLKLLLPQLKKNHLITQDDLASIGL